MLLNWEKGKEVRFLRSRIRRFVRSCSASSLFSLAKDREKGWLQCLPFLQCAAFVDDDVHIIRGIAWQGGQSIVVTASVHHGNVQPINVRCTTAIYAIPQLAHHVKLGYTG